MIRLGLAVLLTTGLQSAAASAQADDEPSSVEVNQVNAAPRAKLGETASPQVGSVDRSTTAPLQMSAPNERRQPVSQLTRSGDRRQTPQLYRGTRTAQPAEPLSIPAEGRTSAVAVVEGDDRCDPSGRAGQRPPACERVIETRSSEFTREVPVMSPEQRLLAEQRSRTGFGQQSAARRLATNSGDPDELSEQAIASVALRQGVTVADSEEEPAALSSDVAAIVQAIAQQAAEPR